VQIGGPLGGILPASLLDTPFDFDPLAEVGCMVGHGSIPSIIGSEFHTNF
jgi:NADH-quinone oxidoreductase subunit F